MLFHEIYGSYFNVVADVLKDACAGALTDKRLSEIIRAKAFDESILGIPASLKGGWFLLTNEMETTITHPPQMPLTTLQKRWLKAILNDRRIKLFDVTDGGLEDIEPLYNVDDICYFDRYLDGDPFEDEKYVGRFRSILKALKEMRLLRIIYIGRDKVEYTRICFPKYLEYSSKDDKFRLLAIDGSETVTINLGRVVSVELLDRPEEPLCGPLENRQCVLTVELKDERKAMERAMLHFSHLKKETTRLDTDSYKMTLYYDREDETELLIRILAFGPMLQVTSPDRFIDLIRERLIKQAGFIV